VQITLQVRSLPEEDETTGVDSVCFHNNARLRHQTNTNQALTILPHLLHTALLALLSASIPLSTTLTSVVIALPTSSSPLLSPTANELLRAKPVKSVHVFAFSGDRRLLLNESDGAFSYKEWEEACEMAEEVCCREEEEGGVSLGGESMDVDGKSGNLDGWLRETMRRKVEWEQRWKSGT
jgi:exosome complex component RRP46